MAFFRCKSKSDAYNNLGLCSEYLYYLLTSHFSLLTRNQLLTGHFLIYGKAQHMFHLHHCLFKNIKIKCRRSGRSYVMIVVLFLATEKDLEFDPGAIIIDLRDTRATSDQPNISEPLSIYHSPPARVCRRDKPIQCPPC